MNENLRSIVVFDESYLQNKDHPFAAYHRTEGSIRTNYYKGTKSTKRRIEKIVSSGKYCVQVVLNNRTNSIMMVEINRK